MRSVEEIENQIRSLPRADFAKLREWFLAQDARAWGAQFESDVLGAAARRAHAEGKTTKL